MAATDKHLSKPLKTVVYLGFSMWVTSFPSSQQESWLMVPDHVSGKDLQLSHEIGISASIGSKHLNGYAKVCLLVYHCLNKASTLQIYLRSLKTLLDMLMEQDTVTNALQDEHTGFVQVDFKGTLRNHCQGQAPPSSHSPSV